MGAQQRPTVGSDLVGLSSYRLVFNEIFKLKSSNVDNKRYDLISLEKNGLSSWPFLCHQVKKLGLGRLIWPGNAHRFYRSDGPLTLERAGRASPRIYRRARPPASTQLPNYQRWEGMHVLSFDVYTIDEFLFLHTDTGRRATACLSLTFAIDVDTTTEWGCARSLSFSRQIYLYIRQQQSTVVVVVVEEVDCVLLTSTIIGR